MSNEIYDPTAEFSGQANLAQFQPEGSGRARGDLLDADTLRDELERRRRQALDRAGDASKHGRDDGAIRYEAEADQLAHYIDKLDGPTFSKEKIIRQAKSFIRRQQEQDGPEAHGRQSAAEIVVETAEGRL